MRLLIALAIATASLAAQSADTSQVFVLKSGDYTWLPVSVHRIPTAVDCHFEVVGGNPPVHAELVSSRDFVLYSRGREYETLAVTPSGGAGGFRRIIETRGNYRIVILNDRGAPAAAVNLTVHVDVDPEPSTVTTGISTRRKIGVILASLALFVTTVIWSGRKLLRAYKLKES